MVVNPDRTALSSIIKEAGCEIVLEKEKAKTKLVLNCWEQCLPSARNGYSMGGDADVPRDG